MLKLANYAVQRWLSGRNQLDHDVDDSRGGGGIDFPIVKNPHKAVAYV